VLSLDRSAARFAWSIASAHLFGHSISLERGISAGVTAEFVRRAIGASADVTTITGDGRAYLRGFGMHDVVALRIAGGASTGDPMLRQAFLLGGAGPNTDPATFASDAFSLLRGFPADSFAGSHAALVNADYRWPIARVERGLGVWPLFLHTVHAAVFVDAGHAWTTSFARRDAKTSIGAELAADLVLGYRLPITAAFGAAWGHDGRRLVPDGVTIFFRLGKAF
jgi:outer membrane protein assembly factor BamA